MAEMTARELEAIRGLLAHEQMLVKKYRMYGGLCCDPQLRTKCEQAAARHQNHYNTLMKHLG